jgi:hypothetical protein
MRLGPRPFGPPVRCRAIADGQNAGASSGPSHVTPSERSPTGHGHTRASRGSPEWANTTVIPGDRVIEEITRLKQSPDGSIIQYGIGQLTYARLEHDLLDELRLWMHPLIVGEARPTTCCSGRRARTSSASST